MTRSMFNPKPADYGGQYRLGGIAVAVGAVLLFFGLGIRNDVLNAVMVILGTALGIGGGAVILSAYRSQVRDAETKR